MIERKKTRQIKIGDVAVGGGAPVSIQSMTNTDTRDTEATIAQIQRLEAAGCEIVRCAVVDENAAKAFRTIRDAVRIPLIADIHFDYKLAIAFVNMLHGFSIVILSMAISIVKAYVNARLVYKCETYCFSNCIYLYM